MQSIRPLEPRLWGDIWIRDDNAAADTQIRLTDCQLWVWDLSIVSDLCSQMVGGYGGFIYISGLKLVKGN